MTIFDEAIARRKACDLELWNAEARVSTQLARLEASYQKDLHTRLREQRALDVAMTQLKCCLQLRADLVRAL